MRKQSIPVSGYIISRIYIYLLVLVILIPVLIMVILSFSGTSQVSETFLYFFPKKLTVANYVKAINLSGDIMGIPLIRMFFNSIIVTSVSILLSVIISAVAGFGFSNYNFKGKEFLFIVTLLTMMIPIQTYIIPLFFLIKKMHLLSNYFGLIFPYSTIGIPLSVLLFRSFFEEIPKELGDAARIDGASDFNYFLKIVLPMSRPVIATVIIFLFLTFWNEFLLALVLIQDYTLQTIPLAMSRMVTGKAPVPPAVYASFVVMVVVPIIIIFSIFQKWFIRGISAGALKG